MASEMAKIVDLRKKVSSIDEVIDAIYFDVIRREKLAGRKPPRSPGEWQNAWDRNPDLFAQEREQFGRRHDAQVALDERLRIANASPWPKLPAPKKCPTCGSHTLYAA